MAAKGPREATPLAAGVLEVCEYTSGSLRLCDLELPLQGCLQSQWASLGIVEKPGLRASPDFSSYSCSNRFGLPFFGVPPRVQFLPAVTASECSWVTAFYFCLQSELQVTVR